MLWYCAGVTPTETPRESPVPTRCAAPGLLAFRARGARLRGAGAYRGAIPWGRACRVSLGPCRRLSWAYGAGRAGAGPTSFLLCYPYAAPCLPSIPIGYQASAMASSAYLLPYTERIQDHQKSMT